MVFWCEVSAPEQEQAQKYWAKVEQKWRRKFGRLRAVEVDVRRSRHHQTGAVWEGKLLLYLKRRAQPLAFRERAASLLKMLRDLRRRGEEDLRRYLASQRNRRRRAERGAR
jgi:hypothetical protein